MATHALLAYVLGMDFNPFSRKALFTSALTLCISINALAQGNAVWVDAVPVTRRVFGAAPEADFQILAGWSGNIAGNGWRALTGVALSELTTDNFGTEINTNSQDITLRLGYRWFAASESTNDSRCKPVWGLDAVARRDRLSTRSSNVDFTSTFTTTQADWGLSGVLGVDIMVAPKVHLIMETRLDGVYRTDATVQNDSFGGDFEQVDRGWEAQLNAPLSLFVALGL